MEEHLSYTQKVWHRFFKHRLGAMAFFVVIAYCLVGIYAPFLASSKPIVVAYDGTLYFPLFRVLFFIGFFTKRVDIFFNLLMFTLPFFLTAFYFGRSKRLLLFSLVFFCQIFLFIYFVYKTPRDPAADPVLSSERRQELKMGKEADFAFDLRFLNPAAKLNRIISYRLEKEQHERLVKYFVGDQSPSTVWQLKINNKEKQKSRYQKEIDSYERGESSDLAAYKNAKSSYQYLIDKQNWLEAEDKKITFILMPFIRSFHWEDDAGGGQKTNLQVPWYELTRINRKDLLAALIFGVRISLVVGILAVSLALIIGIPIGSFAGYYCGKFDIIVCRILEVWESMPTFFMLLLVVAILQSKSIFIVIAVIGFFGWTSFSRYIRAEFFKQRNLSYVEACYSLGFKDSYIIFSHILPNAIPPVLTLLPFAIMGAITTEAGLSFLGLGEEGSCSWGVLMDEGRSAFPGESYLLWPPAILLTTLLVSIALVGDALRDTIDPKMQK